MKCAGLEFSKKPAKTGETCGIANSLQDKELATHSEKNTDKSEEKMSFHWRHAENALFAYVSPYGIRSYVTKIWRCSNL